MEIREVKEKKEKQKITRTILEALPDWFEVAETRENYIQRSGELPLFAVFDQEEPVGFLCL